VLPDDEWPTRPMHVLYPAGRRPTVKIRTFVDALLDDFGG
jgi:DNA-binding transcriptional LysR family regulator